MADIDRQWEDLRRDARKIEGDLDVKLSSYAKLGGMMSHGSALGTSPDLASDGSWKSMEMEIESLLTRLLDINESMSHCVAAATSTASLAQKLARHREILHDFSQEFKRTKNNINSMREHAELLSSVRNDISEYKAQGGPTSGVGGLLRERGQIHSATASADEVLAQAQATRSALTAQRGLFVEIGAKLKHLGDRFPVIRSTLTAIRRKRSRDTYILGSVIAACTVFLLLYWLSK
ncbi:SNARE protein [Klebsormidium nitens]|uniref:Golgi SNAP receptor complex member 1 n=1 Tax=Klebsormidium nitens TaxID=105231 RepID=A0A1Y1ICH4_KLENI|nr:SNARE protein [Klebsormidium nitens]|eukprot:GAQ88665.1 SNARE protein [Klebsormidium nitens]